MPVKNFKQRAQKTVSTKHASRSDLYRRDTRLVRDRLHCAWRRFCFWSNERATLFRRARVTDPHRDTTLDRRLNGLRMQHLCTEVSKLRGFTIRQSLDG